MASPQGISGRTIGLIGAAVLALVFIAVLWFARQPTPAGPAGNDAFFPEDPSEIPNIEDAQTGDNMVVTMVDKDDPTRVAATLAADRFEPIGEGRRRLDNPESWIYLEDGRAVRVTADRATLMMPDTNQPPESGTLEGNIEIRAYDSTPAPGTPAEPDAEPTLIATFDEPVEFERRYLRLRSAGDFAITSEQFDFSGRDLTVILNDLRNRVELIDVVEGDTLVIRAKPDGGDERAGREEPAERVAAADDLNGGTAGKAEPTGESPASEAAAMDELAGVEIVQAPEPTRYHITLSDEVVASLGDSGRALADTLELWAAMVDGGLPEGAIRDIAFADAADAEPAPAVPAESERPEEAGETSVTVVDGAEQSESLVVAEANEPVETVDEADEARALTITWDGRMTVRPLDDQIVPELAQDDFTLRMSADEGSGLTFVAPERGFTGQAFETTYYATRGLLDMEGMETEAGIVRLGAEAGSLMTRSLEADLATGVIAIDDRGTIALTGDDGEAEDEGANIQWKNEAEFALAMIDGDLTDRLERARFAGAVMAKQGGNGLGARELVATLDPRSPPELALRELALSEGVLSSANDELLSGRELTISFAPSAAGDELDPTRVVAVGQALARTPEQMLRAQRMETELERGADGRVSMRTAVADGDVTYRGADRTSARAARLTADGQSEVIVLTGPDAQVAQGGSSITGEHITLDGRGRGIAVAGPGTFEHDVTLEDAAADAPVTGHIRASWAGSMRFDDALGSIVCQDDVLVISTPDAYTRDTLEAARAEIKITARPSADPIDAGGESGREFLSARVFGRAPAGATPVPATVESRTYSAADPERAISVLYLEGTQILADNQRQTLTVPTPGTLLILDRADEAPGEVEDAGRVAAGPGPGLTRFTWRGEMLLARGAGTAVFSRGVQVDHKTLASDRVARLSTDRIDARFDLGDSAVRGAGSTRLLGATASGSVRFMYEGRELIADEAIYDAVSDSLFARALDDRRVTLYDESQPAPMSAETMRWDLGADRIEINAPTPMRGTGG